MRRFYSFSTGLSVRGLLLFAVLMCGCGSGSDRPELQPVEGTVTLDGKPVNGATVLFQPANGRPSKGVTDESGQYELIYRPGVEGAVLGTHKVSISTYREARPDAEDPALQAEQKETIPAQYNVNTTLTAEVKADNSDPINFDLKPGGTILSPDSESSGQDASCR